MVHARPCRCRDSRPIEPPSGSSTVQPAAAATRLGSREWCDLRYKMAGVSFFDQSQFATQGLDHGLINYKTPAAKSFYRSIYLDNDIWHCFLYISLIFLQTRLFRSCSWVASWVLVLSDWESHGVYRVPGFLSSRPNRLPLTPSPVSECCHPPPPFGSKGAHSLAGEGAVGANSDEGTDTL